MYDDRFAEGLLIGSNNNNGGFGNGWEGLIGLALVAGLFDNGNGGGLFNRSGNNNNSCCTAGLATQADLANGFAQNTLQRGIDDIILGQATMQNFINQGFSGVNSTVERGFAGVNNAICTLGYQNQAGFNALSTQLASCCCDIERAIDGVNFNAQKNTCDIIRAGQDNTRAILDFLTSEKISSLQAENSGLKAQISNDRQTTNIVNELRNSNCPIPAFLRPDPNCCYNPFGFGTGYGYNSGCCGASVQ